MSSCLLMNIKTSQKDSKFIVVENEIHVSIFHFHKKSLHRKMLRLIQVKINVAHLFIIFWGGYLLNTYPGSFFTRFFNFRILEHTLIARCEV